jgi:hypothetical protein
VAARELRDVLDLIIGDVVASEVSAAVPVELRGLHAVAHNLLNRWDTWRQAGFYNSDLFTKVSDKIGALRESVIATTPLMNAHFKAADEKGGGQ